MFPLRERRSVLIVEDDKATRTMFETALRAAGFRTISAGDGLQALQVLDVTRPSLIVLDLGLPGLSGRDVAREVLASPVTRPMPIVVVTGLDTEDLPASPHLLIIRKPVTPEEIVATVEGHVDPRRRR